VGEAEAAAIQKKGEAEAEVMRQKAEAFKQYGEAAIVQSIVDKVSSLQAHNLIPIYTNSDYCLAACCTWIPTTLTLSVLGSSSPPDA
jgi:hypothetical protein